jgi:uncharacterized LabA/DUF88 family protein
LFLGRVLTDRVIVFIDAQNMYQGARRAFFQVHDFHTRGQFRPDALDQLIVASGPPAAVRALQEVRIYSGRPDATRQPQAYAAHMKQCHAWSTAGATVITRPLRYPHTWPHEKAQEKGIDVLIAVDLVTLAIDNAYDIAVLASADTDLIPALEYVARQLAPAKKAEVAAWRSASFRGRLSVTGVNVWCHWLDIAKYQQLADSTDYNI